MLNVTGNTYIFVKLKKEQMNNKPYLRDYSICAAIHGEYDSRYKKPGCAWINKVEIKLNDFEKTKIFRNFILNTVDTKGTLFEINNIQGYLSGFYALNGDKVLKLVLQDFTSLEPVKGDHLDLINDLYREKKVYAEPKHEEVPAVSEVPEVPDDADEIDPEEYKDLPF